MDDPLSAVALFVIIIVAIFFGGCIGSSSAEARYQEEAVKRGHAVWVVQPNGSTTFQWK